jgi:hypothetical protein
VVVVDLLVQLCSRLVGQVEPLVPLQLLQEQLGQLQHRLEVLPVVVELLLVVATHLLPRFDWLALAGASQEAVVYPLVG